MSLQDIGVIIAVTFGSLACFALAPWAWEQAPGVWHAVRHPRGVTLRIIMSSYGSEDDNEEIGENEDESAVATTSLDSNNAIAITQQDRNLLLVQGKAEALAAMVKAEKIGETEGIKLVFKVGPSSSNPKYLEARAALKSEIAKLESGPVFRQADGSQTTREGVVISPPYVEQN